MLISIFGIVDDDFLQKVNLDALQKETGLDIEGIGTFVQMKNPRGVYKWAKNKNDESGTRPSYNAIVRLLQKGATTKTLFGVDAATTYQPAPEPAENREPIDYQDPKFLAALEKGMALIEERKKQGIK
jgi:hypothetical protein